MWLLRLPLSLLWIFLRFLLSGVLFIALGVGLIAGLAFWLTTESAQNLILPVALREVNARIKGTVGLSHIYLRQDGRFQFTHLSLHDTEKNQVLLLPSLTGLISWRSLVFDHALVLTGVEASGLSVDLHKDRTENWTLLDAISLKNPGPETHSAASTWSVKITPVRLNDAKLQIDSDAKTSGASSPVVIEHVNAQLELDAQGDTITAQLKHLGFDVLSPRALSVKASASLEKRGNKISWKNLKVQEGRASLDSEGSFELPTEATVASYVIAAKVRNAQVAQRIFNSDLKLAGQGLPPSEATLSAKLWDASGQVSLQGTGQLKGTSAKADVTLIETSRRMGRQRLRAQVRASHINPNKSIVLDSLNLETSLGAWKLSRPSALAWAPQLFVRDFELTSGNQKVRIDGGLEAKGEPNLTIETTALNLAALPLSVFVPQATIQGLLDTRLRLFGTFETPEGVGRVALKDAAWDVGTLAPMPQLNRVRQVEFLGEFSLSAQNFSVAMNANVPRLHLSVTCEGARRGLLERGAKAVPFADWLNASPLVFDAKVAKEGIEGNADKLEAVAHLERSPAGELAAWARGFVHGRTVVSLNADFKPLQKSGSLHAKIHALSLAEIASSLQAFAPPGGGGGGAAQASLPLTGLLNAAVDLNITGDARTDTAHLAFDLTSPPNGTNQFVVVADTQGDFEKALALFASSGVTSSDGTSSDRSSTGTAATTGERLKQALAGLPLVAQVVANVPDLAAFQSLLPGTDATMGGKFNTNVRFDGEILAPRAHGSIRFEKGRLALPNLRTLRNVNLIAFIENDILDVRNMSLDTGGRLQAKGRVEALFSGQPRFDFAFASDDLVLEPARYPQATLDARLRAHGVAGPKLIDVTVETSQFRVFLPEILGGDPVQSLARNPEIKITPPVTLGADVGKATVGMPVAEKSAAEKSAVAGERLVAGQEATNDPQNESKNASKDASQGTRDVRVHIIAPRNVWVTGPDILAEFSTDLFVTVGPAATLLQGKVELLRTARVEVYGRQFQVESATLQFRNDEVMKGELDVNAQHESEEAQVLVSLRGPLAAPKLGMQSQPPMSEFKIASLLVTGRSAGLMSENSSGETDAAGGDGKSPTAGNLAMRGAANALSGLVSSRIQSFLSKRTPLAVTLEVKDPELGKGVAGFGTYVSPDLFVSFDKKFGAEMGENSNEVRFDYRLRKRLTLEGYYGDGQEGGLDLLWKKNY